MKVRELFKDKRIVGSPVLHFVKLVIVMMVIWLLLSGRLEAKFLIYGIGTSVIGAYICMPLLIVDGVSGEKKYFAFNFNLFRMLGYLVWLAWQLILANIEVAKAVVSPSPQIGPQVVKFKVYMDNPMALAVLANSITLTPGTVTMDVTDDGIYTIHALTDNTANGIISGDMQGKVAKLFGEDTRFEILEVVPEGANDMFNEMKRNAEEKEVVR